MAQRWQLAALVVGALAALQAAYLVNYQRLTTEATALGLAASAEMTNAPPTNSKAATRGTTRIPTTPPFPCTHPRPCSAAFPASASCSSVTAT